MVVIESCVEYLDNLYFSIDWYDEKNIIFTSDLKDITVFHYMEQPKSLLVRKLIKVFLMNNTWDFSYKWLPKCFLQRYLYNFVSKKMNYINDYY